MRDARGETDVFVRLQDGTVLLIENKLTAGFHEQVHSDPDFDYKSLKLPVTLVDATAILSSYYRLGTTN